MPISTKKFNTFTFNHADQVDDLYQVQTTEQIKTNFDSRAEQLRVALVGLIDNLLSIANGDSGASNIGIQPVEGAPGGTVYDVILSLRNNINNVSLGGIPDNTITNNKLVTDIKIGSLASLQGNFPSGTRDSIVNAVNYCLTEALGSMTLLGFKLDSTEAVSVATANKLLRLNAFSKLDASINGDSTSVNGKTAGGTLATTEQTNLTLAINELVTSIAGKVATTLLSAVATANSVASRDGSGNLTGNQLISSVAQGTAPLQVGSTTKVTNLNADYVDGLSTDTASTPSTIMSRDASGNSNVNQMNFTAPQGTPPFTVSSTTKVSGLNADLLGSYFPSSFAKTVQEANNNPTLLNGWVNLGGADSVVAYHKDTMGYVHIQGTVKSGTIGSPIFNLPTGYRPAESQNMGTCCSGNYAVIRVNSNGDVTPSVGSTAWTSLNNITFRAGN